MINLARTRVLIETAEWHLGQIIDLGDSLRARRDRLLATEPGNGVARAIAEDPFVTNALEIVERARVALDELGKWKDRGDAS
ncbi:hypothetical protein [Agromyces humi]|uniref:hypothetical protein n=1 Tax=Agromyces humi TaxID=1766800 RepID=UPI0013569975|nr:hypothetical protein [Agromyces humi]